MNGRLLPQYRPSKTISTLSVSSKYSNKYVFIIFFSLLIMIKILIIKKHMKIY